MKRIIKTFSWCLLVAAMGTLLFACKKNIDERPLSDSNLNADFTVTTADASGNSYIAKVKDSSYIASMWDMGDGSGPATGRSTQPVFYPDAGVYTLTHYAIGKGGSSFSSSKTITVTSSDPARGNLVQGGKFETAADEAKWTRLVISAPAVQWQMAGGKMVATGGSWGHSAIYQTIQVQANKDYRFKMQVSGSGASDTWFEVYFGTVAPTQNSDYSNGGNQIGLNTWAGCGNTPFNGNIASIGCSGALVGKNGLIRFTQSGTVYLLIKTGGANLGTSGISIDNVELRGV